MLTSFSTSQLNKFNINFITATISKLNNLWESRNSHEHQASRAYYNIVTGNTTVNNE